MKWPFMFAFVFLLLLLISTIPAYKQKDDRKIDIVVARYKEDISWVPKNVGNLIVYNKGPDNLTVHSIPLKNIGRDAHTYLTHIVNNYNSLADVTVFIPGSGNNIHKRGRIDRLFGYVFSDRLDNCVIGSSEPIDYQFHIDQYASTSSENYNGKDQLSLCPIRPYGKWHEMVVGSRWANFISFNLISAFSRDTIRQYPIEFYQKILSYVSKDENSECIHYIERSWASIFWPYPEESRKDYTLFESGIRKLLETI